MAEEKLDTTKLDQIENLMRQFWGEKNPATDVRSLAVEALNCAECGGSPTYLTKLLADMQVGKLNQHLNASACEEIASKIRKLLDDG